MSAEDDTQFDNGQPLWDESFRRNILNAEWPAAFQGSTEERRTPCAPIYPPVFSDGRIGLSVLPPLPQRYPPMTSHLLQLNGMSSSQSNTSSSGTTSAHDTDLSFQSQVPQAFAWPEEFNKTQSFDPGHQFLDNDFGPFPSSSPPVPITSGCGMMPMITMPMRGVDESYMTHRTSMPWAASSIHHSPTPPAPRPPGPDRSRKSRHQQRDPLYGPQGVKTRQLKRAAACWRCRKYRKPCDDELICTSCQVGNFRVWPSALGCRRDNLEGFALAIIPPSAEDLLRTLPAGLTPTPSWRLSVLSKSLRWEDLFSDPASQSWSPLAAKVHATGLFGVELVELLNIVNTYQARQKTKNSVLEATCTLFSASCDFYNVFVISAGTQHVSPSAINIAATIQEIRTSMARSLSLFLSLCVSSKRADWFPSVLSFAVFVSSLAMFMDAAVVMPIAARTELWADVTSFCRGLRAQLYPTALDLLRIRANNDKQMAPLKLDCWNWVPEKVTSMNIQAPSTLTGTDSAGSAPRTSTASSGGERRTKDNTTRKLQPMVAPRSSTSSNYDAEEELTAFQKRVRNPEGMRLVGADEAAFDGFTSLQAWLNDNEQVLKQGKILFSNDPFTSPTVAAVCTLAPIFGVR